MLALAALATLAALASRDGGHRHGARDGGLVDKRLVDVGDDTTTGNGGTDESIKLLVSTNRKQQVTGRDTLYLKILASISSKLKHLSAVRATLTGRKTPQDGLRVMSEPTNCIRRRYRMAYTPSGFWSRLISRLIINLRRSGLMEEQAASTHSGPPIIYWRRGIVIIHTGGRFIVESIQSTKKCEPPPHT